MGTPQLHLGRHKIEQNQKLTTNSIWASRFGENRELYVDLKKCGSGVSEL
ncbi:hypothetical protein WN943_003086 [Citrus x changshan-huyou]